MNWRITKAFDPSKHPRRPKGDERGGEFVEDESKPSRAERAKRSYVRATKEKQDLGDGKASELAKALGGSVTDDNEPMDVIVKSKRKAIEVKAIIDSKHDRIYMRRECRRRKEKFGRARQMELWTLGVDVRGGKERFYVAKGVGAFRFGSMKQASTWQEVRAIILGKKG